jgi:hypothetical protein
MQTKATSEFSPEVTEYLMLNGYRLADTNTELGLMTFTRGNVAVVFFQDKIERRIISNDKAAVHRTMKSFKGFDGQNIFKLMMILHCIDAVDLHDVAKRADAEKKKHFRELVDDLLSSMVAV